AISLVNRNAQMIQEVRHGGVNVRIGAANRVSLLAKHSRERRHRCSTDANEIDHLNYRGFQKLEYGRRRGEVQTRAYTEWDNNIRPRSVSSGEPVEHGE